MNKKKIIRNLIFVLAILILMVILVVNLGDIKTIWRYLSKTNIWIVLLGAGILILYALINQLSLIFLIKFRFKEIKYFDAYCISGSEYFFNSITPFSSGGQPFQAYALKRKGMSLSNSTSVLLINFIAYQICLTFVSIIFMILYYGRVKEQISSFIWFLIVGFSINTLIMVGLVLIGISKRSRQLFLKMFDLICKIKPLRRFQNRHDRFEQSINNMQTAFKEMVKSWKLGLFVFFTKILSFMVYYSIPFVILYSIGVKININDLPYVMALTSFSLTIATWVPTPGGAGGVEAAFTLLYSPLLISYGYEVEEAKNISIAIMVIWRLLTYYLLIFYGFVLYLLFEKRDGSISSKKEDVESKNSGLELSENNSNSSEANYVSKEDSLETN